VGGDDLNRFLLTIRRQGASVTHCFPCSDGYTVIYTTLGD